MLKQVEAADACACEEACVEAKKCVAWQFYLVGVKPGKRNKSPTRCFLKSDGRTEAAVGNWGGVVNRTAIKLAAAKKMRAADNGDEEDEEDEEADYGGCYAEQSAIQANLAPWAHLRVSKAAAAVAARPVADGPQRSPAVAVGSGVDPTPSTTQQQLTHLFWMRRTGINGKFGQDPQLLDTARAAALAPWGGSPGYNSSAPQRFTLASLSQLAPSTGSDHSPEVLAAIKTGSWDVTAKALTASSTKYIVVDAKNGLGNRLRAIGSAMAYAQSAWRPLLVVWAKDRHCGCGVEALFASPLPFALLEVEIELSQVDPAVFEIADYMEPSTRNMPISLPREKHVYFKSGYVINQVSGAWAVAQRQLQRLVPTPAVSRMLLSNRSMVGVHVRTVFDAPLAQTSAKEKALARTEGTRAIALANKEYGAAATKSLLLWRKASRWQNFVGKMKSLWEAELRARRAKRARSTQQQQQQQQHEAPLFYVAADSQEAYEGLTRALPAGAVVYTKRACKAERCDLRDCEALVYSLVDMLNLARTKFILGSSWSSYSEVAAYWGGEGGEPLDLFQAGKDFGQPPPRYRNPS